jgi:hypothetical protein
MGALHLYCPLDGVARAGEGEEGTRRPAYRSRHRRLPEDVAHDLPVAVEDFSVPVAELLEQRRRSFDVGEDERHGPARQPFHVVIVMPVAPRLTRAEE